MGVLALGSNGPKWGFSEPFVDSIVWAYTAIGKYDDLLWWNIAINCYICNGERVKT